MPVAVGASLFTAPEREMVPVVPAYPSYVLPSTEATDGIRVLLFTVRVMVVVAVL